jgi:hypothetical protein
VLQQQAVVHKTEQSHASKIVIKVDENPDWTDAQIA